MLSWLLMMVKPSRSSSSREDWRTASHILRAALGVAVGLCVAPAEVLNAGGGNGVLLEFFVQIYHGAISFPMFAVGLGTGRFVARCGPSKVSGMQSVG